MEEEEGETYSQSLEGIYDLNHVFLVGEIRVSLGEGLEEKLDEYVACKEYDRKPTYFVILEDIRRRKEENLVEFLINCSKGYERRKTTKLQLAIGDREDNMDFSDMCEESQS